VTSLPVAPGRIQSVVSYRVGGREYAMKTNRQCKVCMSEYRFQIEEHLISGRVYKRIHESLPEDAEISVRNIKDHYNNGHMPLEQAAIRQIVETRAEKVGKRIEDSVDSLVDGMTLAEVVVQKTFDAIAAGEIRPDLKDGLTAAKFLAEMGEYDEGGSDMAAITEAFIVYHEQAEQVMSPEQFEAFGQALKTNPVLKALASRYDGEKVEGEVLDSRDEALAGRLDSD
jgi:hypothetical protein